MATRAVGAGQRLAGDLVAYTAIIVRDATASGLLDRILAARIACGTPGEDNTMSGDAWGNLRAAQLADKHVARSKESAQADRGPAAP
jgi:hypothetical protein